MRPSPLAEPGILLRMIPPEPMPATSCQVERAGAWWALVRNLPAAALGAALAAFLLLATARQRVDLPFGAAAAIGWWGCAGLAALAAGGGRRLRSDLGRVVGGGSGFAVAMVGILGWIGLHAAGASLLVVALAITAVVVGGLLGVVVGRSSSWQPLLAVLVGAAAVASLGRSIAGLLPADAGFLAVCALVLVAAVAAVLWPARAGPPLAPAARLPGRSGMRWLALGLAVGLLGFAVASGFAASLAGAAALAAVVVAMAALAQPAPTSALAASALAAMLVAAAGDRPGLAVDERLVATAQGATVTYVRATQELRLRVGGVLVDAVGPDRSEAALVVTLLHAFTQPGDRVLVLGAGAGRVVEHVTNVGARSLDVVDWHPAAAALRPCLSGAGPVVRPGVSPPAPRLRVGGAPAALSALAAGSRQAVVLAEPLADDAPATQIGIQHELARVAGGGPVLQVLALDRTPAAALQALFAAAAAAHRWNGLFLVGDGAVLVSGDVALAAPPVPPMPAWSPALRWLAHEAHLGDTADLQRALLGTLQPPAVGAVAPEATTVGRAAALDVVRAWLQPAAAPASSADSVLSRWTAMQAELRVAVARLRALADDPAGRAEAQRLATRFLHVGAPRPELQAALGLPTEDGVTMIAPASASRRALALDPTFFATPPAVCASLPMPVRTDSDLEDLAQLPPPPRLAEVASGDDPLAVALRARFPSRCARALVAALADGPLPPAASQALRELADPFVLREVAAVVVPRGRVRELLGLWRGDLAMPPELARLVQGGAEDRRTLAAALRGRQDPSCRGVLADLMEAPELEVRQLAAEALQHHLPARIPYDPHGTQSARHEAAERLRSLHNRTP